MIRQSHLTVSGLAVCTFLCFVTASWGADTVTRKSDGKKTSGTIIDMKKDGLKVKKSIGEPEEFAANDIGSIAWEGAGPDFSTGISAEDRGDLEQALDRYAKAKTGAKNPGAALKAEIEYLTARVMGKMALTDAAKRTEAIKKLEAVQKSDADHIRYFESVALLARLQLANGDFAAARNTFTLLGRATWNESKMASQIGLGRVLAAESKFDDANKAFEAAIGTATDAPLDQFRKYEAMLGQARLNVAQNKHEDAIKILEVIKDKGPIDDTATQAETYVLLGNCEMARSHPKEAALAYLAVDLLPNFAREATSHAEALCQLTKVWTELQEGDKAREFASKLEKKYPKSEWLAKVTLPKETKPAAE